MFIRKGIAYFCHTPPSAPDNKLAMIMFSLADEVPGYDADEVSDESDIDSADNFYSSCDDSDGDTPPREPPACPPVTYFNIRKYICFTTYI